MRARPWRASIAVRYAYGARHEDVLAISLVVVVIAIVAMIALRNHEKVPVEIDTGLRAFARGELTHD